MYFENLKRKRALDFHAIVPREMQTVVERPLTISF